jgi:hypothetical protein
VSGPVADGGPGTYGAPDVSDVPDVPEVVTAGSLPTVAAPAPSTGMDDETRDLDAAPAPATPGGAVAMPTVSPVPPARVGEVTGALRPANEVVLEQLAPSSPMLRRRAFSSLLRVLLTSKGE